MKLVEYISPLYVASLLVKDKEGASSPHLRKYELLKKNFDFEQPFLKSESSRKPSYQQTLLEQQNIGSKRRSDDKFSEIIGVKEGASSGRKKRVGTNGHENPFQSSARIQKQASS